MIDPATELVTAIIARLRADSAVSAFTSARIYERPPDGAVGYPYIAMGPYDDVPDDAECIDGAEITLQIDCYSQGPGEAFSRAEVGKLAGAVSRALHNAEFTLTENALCEVRRRLTRYTREGTLNRAIISITARIELG